MIILWAFIGWMIGFIGFLGWVAWREGTGIGLRSNYDAHWAISVIWPLALVAGVITLVISPLLDWLEDKGRQTL